MTLTREEIMAMKPGRELDMLVNQHLFGYSVRSHRSHLVYREGVKIDRTDFLPSTFLPNAWEVYEKFSEISIRKYEAMDTKFRYVCRIETEFIDLSVPALTAPEAICKAALLAVLNL